MSVPANRTVETRRHSLTGSDIFSALLMGLNLLFSEWFYREHLVREWLWWEEVKTVYDNREWFDLIDWKCSDPFLYGRLLRCIAKYGNIHSGLNWDHWEVDRFSTSAPIVLLSGSKYLEYRQQLIRVTSLAKCSHDAFPVNSTADVMFGEINDIISIFSRGLTHVFYDMKWIHSYWLKFSASQRPSFIFVLMHFDFASAWEAKKPKHWDQSAANHGARQSQKICCLMCRKCRTR